MKKNASPSAAICRKSEFSKKSAIFATFWDLSGQKRGFHCEVRDGLPCPARELRRDMSDGLRRPLGETVELQTCQSPSPKATLQGDPARSTTFSTLLCATLVLRSRRLVHDVRLDEAHRSVSYTIAELPADQALGSKKCTSQLPQALLRAPKSAARRTARSEQKVLYLHVYWSDSRQTWIPM
jgi:hypothetical protein